jgi:dTDP-4-dehydrorhamnose 3,5-epimerase
MPPETTTIIGCEIVPVSANRDARGCLHEIFRESWPNAFHAVQWNVCASKAGVARGAHVHVDYHEFYTLPRGRVLIGLADIRRTSPSFRQSVQFEWSDRDDCAIVVPRGVAHVVVFEEDSVLAFGLSGYWRAEYDRVGCQWNDPEFGFAWPNRNVLQSERDASAGNFETMVKLYEELSESLSQP